MARKKEEKKYTAPTQTRYYYREPIKRRKRKLFSFFEATTFRHWFPGNGDNDKAGIICAVTLFVIIIVFAMILIIPRVGGDRSAESEPTPEEVAESIDS